MQTCGTSIGRDTLSGAGPFLGLALAAGAFFVVGGFNLIKLIIEALINVVQGIPVATEVHGEEVPFMVQIVE